jgi:Flp pilus assembly protein CpaB
MAAGKKRSSRIFIIIILIIAVGAVLAYLLLTGNAGLFGSTTASNQPTPTETPNIDLVDIVIASQSIKRGTLITSDMVTTIKYPRSQMAEGVFYGTIEEVVGQKAKYDIEPTVPLTQSMVMAQEGGSLASFDIPDGMTAFSIPVSPETSVSFAPQSGDHVMVVGCMLLTDLDTDYQTRLPNNTNTTYSPLDINKMSDEVLKIILTNKGTANALSVEPSAAGSLNYFGRYELDASTNAFIYVTASEAQRPRLVCQTIIQDAAILKVGMFSPDGASEPVAAATATPMAGEPTPAVGTSYADYTGSVTLILTPQDTLIMNYLLLSGTKLSLALRSAGDAGEIITDSVTLQYIMDQKNITPAAKLPYNVEPRVDSLVYPGFNDYILVQP